MKAKRSLFLLMTIGLGAVLSAQNLVSSPVKRQETLDQIAGVLAEMPVDWPRNDVARARPFSAIEQAAAVVSATPTENPARPSRPVVVKPPEPTRLPDADALALAARSIRPSGSMISSRGRVLIMTGGNWAEGDVKTFTHRGEKYELTIEKVNVDGYVLRIGGARVTRRFNDSSLDPASSIQVEPAS